METEGKKISSHAKGIIHIILAAFSFSLMALFLKLAGDVPTMQKAFFRNVVAAVLMAVMLARSEDKFRIQKGSLPGLFLRALFGTIGMICNFYAIDHLVLSDSNMLNKISPFAAMIMSVFILKEVPDRLEWLMVIIAFIGAALIIKPTSGIGSIPALIGFVGGISAGTAYTFLRKLGRDGERGQITVFFFSVFTCLFCTPFIIAAPAPMTMQQLIFLILTGISAMLGQLNITAAYTYAPAGEISVFDYSQVIFAALWGLLIFKEYPDALSIIGYVLIIGVAVIKWHYNVHIKALN